MADHLEELTDAQLARLARRDERAFEVLIRRHAPRVRGLATGMVGPGTAEDVVQETFISAYSGLPRFRGEAQFSTWLHRIALNACYKVLRARPLLDLAEIPEPASREDPAAHGEVLALREALAWALAQLPPEQREAVSLRELSELDYAEIARLQGVELGTVKSRINRGRAALRDLLTRKGVTP